MRTKTIMTALLLSLGAAACGSSGVPREKILRGLEKGSKPVCDLFHPCECPAQDAE